MWRVIKSRGTLVSWSLAGCAAAAACSEAHRPFPVFTAGAGGTSVQSSAGTAGSLVFPIAGRSADDLTSCAQAVPPTPLTRWSVLDLDGTLDDLFGPGATLAGTGRVLDRRYFRDVSVGFVSALRDAARERVKSAVAESDTFEVCAPDEDDESCVQVWLSAWGEKLYRRPLTSEQLEAYVAQFQSAKSTLTPA